MSAGPFRQLILDTTATSTARAWTPSCLAQATLSLIVSGLESGGVVQIYVSNLNTPPTAMPATADGTVQWGSNITQDSAIEFSASYAFVSVIKTTAGGSPTETKVYMAGWAMA